jgi:hypothetical protein
MADEEWWPPWARSASSDHMLQSPWAPRKAAGEEGNWFPARPIDWIHYSWIWLAALATSSNLYCCGLRGEGYREKLDLGRGELLCTPSLCCTSRPQGGCMATVTGNAHFL